LVSKYLFIRFSDFVEVQIYLFQHQHQTALFGRAKAQGNEPLEEGEERKSFFLYLVKSEQEPETNHQVHCKKLVLKSRQRVAHLFHSKLAFVNMY
jgi:hypothetical protein